MKKYQQTVRRMIRLYQPGAQTWTQNATARAIDGKPISYRNWNSFRAAQNPSAVCWSLDGAIDKLLRPTSPYKKKFKKWFEDQLLEEVNHKYACIGGVNAGHFTYETIMAFLKKLME